MGQFFLRRNSMDSIPHFTEYTNISISGILQYESRFGSCSIILDEFSPKRKSNFFTATDANDRQPFNLIFGHNNLFSPKVFSPVVSSSSQNQTFTQFKAPLPPHFPYKIWEIDSPSFSLITPHHCNIIAIAIRGQFCQISKSTGGLMDNALPV